MGKGFRYEVFIGATGGFIDGNRLALNWNWRKFAGAQVIATGAGYDSMPDCYRALNGYKAEFGDAPVTINLRYGADSEPEIALPAKRA